MQIHISGHHIDVTPALRNYVTEKLDRLTKHYDHITDVNVILTVEKLVQKAEARINVAKGDVFANAEDEDMYAAIDALSDKLNRQLTKLKEKTVARHHNG
jgi:putative sigma-54 modulation protein